MILIARVHTHCVFSPDASNAIRTAGLRCTRVLAMKVMASELLFHGA
jgi:hypothetical protein